MAYNQQHIDTINRFKPDLKGFNPMDITEQMAKDIIANDSVALAILKFELYFLEYRYRRDNKWMSLRNWTKFPSIVDFLKSNQAFNNSIKDPTTAYFHSDQPVSLVEHLDKPTQYMTPYLAGKYRDEYGLAKASKLNIKVEDNEFSYALVESHLEGKSLNSTQVADLISKIRNFNDPLKTKFINLFLSKCKLPSIALQKQLVGFPNFLSLNMSTARSYSNAPKNVAFMNRFWDYEDSTYNPFVLGVTKQPITKAYDMERLIQVSLVMTEQSNPEQRPLLEGILDYLTIPEHKQDIQDKYIPQLEAAKLAISNLIGAFNGRI